MDIVQTFPISQPSEPVGPYGVDTILSVSEYTQGQKGLMDSCRYVPEIRFALSGPAAMAVFLRVARMFCSQTSLQAYNGDAGPVVTEITNSGRSSTYLHVKTADVDARRLMSRGCCNR